MPDFIFYREVYGGSALGEDAFPECARRAREELEKYKRCYRVRGSEKDEKMAVCAMAEAVDYFNAAQNGSGGAVYYASVGTVSMSGKGVFSQIDLSPRGQERELYRCAMTYLDIYRGAGAC